MTSLTLRNIKKRFGKTEVIRGIDLDVEDGEFVVFVGPSGCGKSTLLRMIAGLEDITAGEFRLRGRVMNEVLAGQARHRDGVPVLCALSAYEGPGQHGFRPEQSRREPDERTGA